MYAHAPQRTVTPRDDSLMSRDLAVNLKTHLRIINKSHAIYNGGQGDLTVLTNALLFPSFHMSVYKASAAPRSCVY